jgi:glycine/D-amino acid oxidase-like deaminating enzyme
MSTTFILGAGIIGTSTAYYLSKHQSPSTIHLVEVSPELFASASGFAGGFLAKDWFSPAVAELGALSFEEHKRLAEQENGAEKWGYSRTTPIAISSAPNMSKEKPDVWFRDGSSRAEAANGSSTAVIAPKWLWTGEGDAVEVIGEDGTVAQV